MNIGIDIDGVLTNLEDWQFSFGSKFTNKVVQKPDAFDVKGIYNLTDEEYTLFLDTFLDDYSKNEPARKHASDVIKKLKKEGNTITIITGRFHTKEDSDEGDKQRNFVYNWLKEHDIEYDEIVFTDAQDNKLNILKNNNIDIMIEDKESTINDLSNFMNVICFDAIYNRNCSGTKIFRVYSWWDIYHCIRNIINND